MPAGSFTDSFSEPEPGSATDLLSVIVSPKLVRLIKHHEIPLRLKNAILQRPRSLFLGGFTLFIARYLIEPHNELMVIRNFLMRTGKDLEFESEFLEQLIPPLLDQASWGNNQNAP